MTCSLNAASFIGVSLNAAAEFKCSCCLFSVTAVKAPCTTGYWLPAGSRGNVCIVVFLNTLLATEQKPWCFCCSLFKRGMHWWRRLYRASGTIPVQYPLRPVLRIAGSTLLILVKYVPIPQQRYQLYMFANENFVEFVFVLRWNFWKTMLRNVLQITEKVKVLL